MGEQFHLDAGATENGQTLDNYYSLQTGGVKGGTPVMSPGSVFSSASYFAVSTFHNEEFCFVSDIPQYFLGTMIHPLIRESKATLTVTVMLFSEKAFSVRLSMLLMLYFIAALSRASSNFSRFGINARTRLSNLGSDRRDRLLES